MYNIDSVQYVQLCILHILYMYVLSSIELCRVFLPVFVSAFEYWLVYRPQANTYILPISSAFRQYSSRLYRMRIAHLAKFHPFVQYSADLANILPIWIAFFPLGIMPIWLNSIHLTSILPIWITFTPLSYHSANLISILPMLTAFCTISQHFAIWLNFIHLTSLVSAAARSTGALTPCDQHT